MLFLGALWFGFVPHNVTFAMGVIYAFSRPLRKSRKRASEGSKDGGRRPLVDVMLQQWLEGIPLDAPTHRNLSVALHHELSRTWDL